MDETSRMIADLEQVALSFYDSDKWEYPKVLEDIRFKFENDTLLGEQTRKALDFFLHREVDDSVLLYLVTRKFNRVARDRTAAMAFLTFVRTSLFCD